MQGNKNPKLFIGSSKEGREIAEYIQLGLHEQAEATVGALAQVSCNFDFAVLVLTPGDVTEKRVLFDLGLFVGTLGKERTFIVHPRSGSPDLPAELAGVTAATYDTGPDGNPMAMVGPLCTQLHAAMCKAAEKTDRSPVVRRRRRRSLGTACTSDHRDVYQIANISASGALLEIARELEARQVGQQFDMDLNLDEETTARVTARVVRVQRPDGGQVGGVGVVFTEVEESSKQTIEQWVEADPTAVD